MFKKVLIANRGEIAVRVMRTLREMNITSVAVYSDVDREAIHVRYADEAVHIGPTQAALSYLNIEKILNAAKKTGSEAIHPGYGFLSENAAMSRACTDAGIVFIGPDPMPIEVMGNKTSARTKMKEAGVPVVPGTTTPLKDLEEARLIAKEMGYPILLKASAGGGGKGMRAVRDALEIDSAFRAAGSEARNAFGDDSLYIEKLIDQPRHIEFQIMCDNFGNALHFCERECSIQRRHQKVIEETPAVVMTEQLRHEMGEVAKKAALAVGYTGAGTIEFLFDKSGNFYFLEMNTRLQVEHPITEMVTGVDLVKLQIEVAAGLQLKMKQDDVKMNGASIECRVYAEDPYNNFMPQPGLINFVRNPGGVGIRNDIGIYAGYKVPIAYDPMISKLSVWAHDRESAISRMQRALEEYLIDGVITNIPFLKSVLNTPGFMSGEYNTDYLETILQDLIDNKDDTLLLSDITLITAAIRAYENALKPAEKDVSESGDGISTWKKVGVKRTQTGWNR